MKRQELAVAALENGTVIDHIPSEKLFEVVALLHLEEMKTSITVGYNLKSKKMGHKSIIKVSNKFFTDDELNLLAVVCPNVSLSIIQDYEVVEKKTVQLPEEVRGIIKCQNPVCITNNEPMRTRFIINEVKGTCRCHYCNKEQQLNSLKLK